MRAFINGHFVSCEQENRIFSVLVEDNGYIIYTGDQLLPCHQEAEIIDLERKTVTPCFGDTHLHLMCAVIQSLDVRHCTDFDSLIDRIRLEASYNPSKILYGVGLNPASLKEQALPTRQVLDQATNKPVMLCKYDMHAAVCNTALLNMFTPHVTQADGYHADTGYLENQAFQEMNIFLSEVGLRPDDPALSAAYSKFWADRIAAVADEYARNGVNLLHAAEAIWDINAILPMQASMPQKLVTYAATLDIDRVRSYGLPRIGGCTETMADGALGTEDAAMREPYTNNPNNTGWHRYPQATWDDFAIRANRHGMQMAAHAIGDAGIEQVITAYERALEDHPRKDHRHIIIHGEMMMPDLLERTAKAGICVSLQSCFLLEEDPATTEYYVGSRAKHRMPLRSMLDAGIILANGSDRTCSLAMPLFSIHACCNHPTEEQRITPIEALRLSTLYAAMLSFDEDKMGSLTEGKIADFVVLDQDILSVPVNTIKDINITDVYFSGQRYESIETCPKNRF